MNRFGIHGGVFGADVPFVERIRRAAAAGFSSVEIVVGVEGLLRFESPIQEYEELGRAARDSGGEVSALSSAAFFSAHFASQAAEARQAARDRTLRMLDAAAACGAGAIVIIPAVVGRAGDARPQCSYADALHLAAAALTELRGDAEARAVTIAIENVWNRFLLSPVEMADFIDTVNSPNVGVCFDTGNVMATGYPDDWIRTLGGRIARVHIKDYDVSRPGREGFCALGSGSVDWPAVGSALREAAYAGPLTYEGGGEPAEIRAALERVLGPHV